MTNIRFDEQVVIVTGGGGGLGSAYARLLAKRGATVVVHDAGVDRAGSGANASVAQSVVDEIVGSGGRALADGKDCSYICDVAVHPSHQGRGLGKEVVSRLVDFSKDHRKIILYAAPGSDIIRQHREEHANSANVEYITSTHSLSTDHLTTGPGEVSKFNRLRIRRKIS